MTSTNPAALAGVTAWICVELFTVTLEADVVPNKTSAPARKFVPVIDTDVPPVTSPLLGETLVTVGEVPAVRLALTKPPHPVTIIVTTTANTAKEKRFIVPPEISKIPSRPVVVFFGQGPTGTEIQRIPGDPSVVAAMKESRLFSGPKRGLSLVLALACTDGQCS